MVADGRAKSPTGHCRAEGDGPPDLAVALSELQGWRSGGGSCSPLGDVQHVIDRNSKNDICDCLHAAVKERVRKRRDGHNSGKNNTLNSLEWHEEARKKAIALSRGDRPTNLVTIEQETRKLLYNLSLEHRPPPPPSMESSAYWKADNNPNPNPQSNPNLKFPNHTFPNPKPSLNPNLNPNPGFFNLTIGRHLPVYRVSSSDVF